MFLHRVVPAAPTLAIVLVAVASVADAAAPRGARGLPASSDPRPRATGPGELMERLGDAWFARDLEAYLALWAFDSPGTREAEEAAALEAFAAEETRLKVLGPPRSMAGGDRIGVEVQMFAATEPEARLEHWTLFLERRSGRWAFVSREAGTDVEGLIHLPMAAQGWRARGVSLRLEDLELRMEDGTLFGAAETVGPTALVFVGRGRVRFSPRPPAEAEQLRQFAGTPQLDRSVKWAFVRLNPEDFEQMIDTRRLQPDPTAPRRREEAIKRWVERAERSFVVDADLPLSPWWLRPRRGDALVEFPWKRGRVLTFTVATGSEEDISFFDRDRGLKICSYPSAGPTVRVSGGQQGPVDVLHHDLSVRFDPGRRALIGEDTLRLRLRSPVPTIRLQLHDDLQVSSVSLEQGGELFFLRVRDQGSFVVSLGPHGRELEELSLRIRYAGRHDPSPVDHELLQVFPEPRRPPEEQALLDPPPIVYGNRTAWYPRPEGEDYATLRAHFDTPEDQLAVTGGELQSVRSAGGRTHATYWLGEPGKYFSAVVGRMQDLGVRRGEGWRVRGFGAPRATREVRENLVRSEAIIDFYTELFGPCPYPVINHVLVESVTPGGHSPPGLVYLQKRPLLLAGRPLPDDPASFGDMPAFFLAHELAHQWWGHGVAPATYREQWLSEAWAQYSAALWVRHRKGEEAFQDMLRRMARWARRYDDRGPINLGQRLGHVEGDPRILRAIVYDKGAWVLHMLRQLMGDEPFFRGTRSFLERHRFAKATTRDLRAALEEASGLDLGPYFERWIYGTGLPTLRWSARTTRGPHGHETTVRVQPGGLPGSLPLEISVRAGEGWSVHRVDLDPAGGSWTIRSPEPVRDVRVNENLGILAEAKRVRRLPPPPQR